MHKKTARLLLVILALIAGLTAGAFVLAAGAETAGISYHETVGSTRYGALRLDYASPASAEALGVPLYPQAKVTRSFVYSAKEYKGGAPAGYLAQAFLTTRDTADKITAFYKQHMGEEVGIESPPQCRETFLFVASAEDTLTVRIVCGIEGKENQIEISRVRLSELAHKPPPAARPEDSCCPQERSTKRALPPLPTDKN